MEELAAKEAPGKPREIWFQDEARVGQKNKITRRWAKRGTQSSAPPDQRTSSAYIFGAICPVEGKGAEIPYSPAGDIVVMDKLSSHKGPAVTATITAAGASVLYLPPYSPDFNSIEKAFPNSKRICEKPPNEPSPACGTP